MTEKLEDSTEAFGVYLGVRLRDRFAQMFKRADFARVILYHRVDQQTNEQATPTQ